MSVSLSISVVGSNTCDVSRALLSFEDIGRGRTDVKALTRRAEGLNPSMLDGVSAEENMAGAANQVTATFSHPDPPKLVALDTHSMNLQWRPVQQLTPNPEANPHLPLCRLEYSLETRLVRGQQCRHWCLCVSCRCKICTKCGRWLTALTA